MSKLRITLFGGVNEIGGNKFLLEEGEDRVFLDFGTSIGARNGYYEEFLQPRTNSVLRDLLRLDLLPDVDGIYRDDLLDVARVATDRDLPVSARAWRSQNGGKPFAHGVLLTHAHVDHFQDVTFLDPSIPVVCTPTTKRMLEVIDDVRNTSVQSEILSARRRSIDSKTSKAFGERASVETTDVPREFREVGDMETFDVGPFRVTAIPVDHSVPGGVAFFVVTPSGKRVFYTGDVRFHGRLADRTSALLKTADALEPDVMLCEGTRMGSETRDNEEGVERAVTDLTREAQGLVVAEFGWKDTTRFDTLARVAHAAGRQLVVDPRLALLLRRLDGHADVPSHRVEAYPHVGVYRRRKKSMLDTEADYDKHELGYDTSWSGPEMSAALRDGDEAFLSESLAHWRKGVTAADVAEHPERYMLHLTFWSSSELLDLVPPQGSRWIRCATEPYSDEMALDLARQRRWIEHFGMEHNVKATKADEEGLLRGTTHVSGHGSGADLIKLIRSAKPRLLVPVHTSGTSLGDFQDLGFDTRIFPGASFRNAAKGRCVVEL